MAAKKQPAPEQYAVKLAKPWPIPGTGIAVPAGDSTVSAEIEAMIPDEIILESKPVDA